MVLTYIGRKIRDAGNFIGHKLKQGLNFIGSKAEHIQRVLQSPFVKAVAGAVPYGEQIRAGASKGVDVIGKGYNVYNTARSAVEKAMIPPKPQASQVRPPDVDELD